MSATTTLTAEQFAALPEAVKQAKRLHNSEWSYTATLHSLGNSPENVVAVEHIYNGKALPTVEAQEQLDPLPDVPRTLKQLRQWVRWRLETVSGKPTKVPYQVNGKKASSTDPHTWVDYRTAVTGATINASGGVGFVVNGDGIFGIDLDGCRNPKTGEVAEWAERVIDACESYTEYTPSETGLRVWARGALPAGLRVFNLDPAVGYGDKVKIEIYERGRYFTVTGDAFYETSDIAEIDSNSIYRMLHDIRTQHTAPVNQKTAEKSATADDTTGVQIVYAQGSNIKTDKYAVFMRGQVVKDGSGFHVTLNNKDGLAYATVTYPSQSEADLGFATVLALVHDGDTEKMDDDFRKSALYREKWEREDYRERTFEKALATAKKVKDSKKSERVLTSTPNLEVREVAEPEKTVSPLVLPNSALTSSVFGDLFDQIFAPNDWTMEFALPALATAGSVLVPYDKVEGQFEPALATLYTALIGGINAGKSQVTEWAARATGIYNDLRSAQYTQAKFGSAEQMWKYLHKFSTQAAANTQNPFRNAVLVNLDEWSHLMSKAGIPDATFTSALTTAFYAHKTTVTLGGQGNGRDILIPFPFSMIGGVVDDQFGHSFNSASTGGLYSRTLFGLAPEGFLWAYRPFPHEHTFFQGKGKLELKPVRVAVNPDVWELTGGWKKNDATLDRIPEIVTRIATIFASVDGRPILTAKDVEKLWSLVVYQKAVRSIHRPNPGTNPDAVYANVALNWIHTHAGQWRTTKELKDGTNYFRRELGPRACHYALLALAQNHDIELWVSEVNSDNELNDVPADYQGKRPKIGMGLVRAVRD